MNRYELTEVPTTCMIMIFRNSKWYQMRPLFEPVVYSQKIISRLRRKGRKVDVTWLTGMGLGV